MNTWFGILTVIFIVLSALMIIVILVQRPSGGGLAGAFGGAGGGGTDTVFGGRVGDALTVVTTIAFVVWLGIAVSLNLVESEAPTSQAQQGTVQQPIGPPTPADSQQTGQQEQPPLDGTTQVEVETEQGRVIRKGTRLPTDAAADGGATGTGGGAEAAGDADAGDNAGGAADGDGANE